ncbi:putative amino acid permease 7 [Turnera subulata]|uniref:Amino acid permease 7 n=1 Tax=Turnera subulata TaxID=218843 RepID=A0A9Q0F2F7_9ROSI|nr:putative amino acid permease 7 [Turnera subulata]
MGGVTEESPLVGSLSVSQEPEDNNLQRTGTIWTAVAHIITAVIGAGVLSLAWTIAQLGWVAGPLAMLAFATVTLLSSFLISDCFRFPDPEYGPNRNQSYLDAVHLYLGQRSHQVCGVLANLGLYLNGVAYTITTASSIRSKDQRRVSNLTQDGSKMENARKSCRTSGRLSFKDRDNSE